MSIIKMYPEIIQLLRDVPTFSTTIFVMDIVDTYFHFKCAPSEQGKLAYHAWRYKNKFHPFVLFVPKWKKKFCIV